jgi:hypothetical protein
VPAMGWLRWESPSRRSPWATAGASGGRFTDDDQNGFGAGDGLAEQCARLLTLLGGQVWTPRRRRMAWRCTGLAHGRALRPMG